VPRVRHSATRPDWALACAGRSYVRSGGRSGGPGEWARFLERRKNAAALMAEPSTNPDAAFLIYRDGAASALHLRCCDIQLQLDPNDHAIEEAIARHLSRVHGYIGSIDEEISLDALLRKLPNRPASK
jgi:hypothetical protein